MIFSKPYAKLAAIFSPNKKEKYPEVDKFFKDADVIKVTNLAVSHDLVGVKKFLDENKTDLNTQGYLWATPMHFAMVWSTPEIITEFVKHGGDPFQLAYSYGTPLSAMLSNIKDSTAYKMEKVKAVVLGGIDVSSQGLADAVNGQLASLNNEVGDALLETLFSLGLKADTRDYDFSFIFGHYHNLDARLDHNVPLFDSSQVDWPLAFEIYKRKLDSSQDKKFAKKIEHLFAKLELKGVTLEMLEERYGPNPTWKSFLADVARQRPNQVNLYLSSIRGTREPYPREWKMPMALTVKLVGEQALQENKVADYFKQALKNLRLVQMTWYQPQRELKLNHDYLTSLPISESNGERRVIFDAFLLFPKWGDMADAIYNERIKSGYSVSDDTTILELSTGFEQTSNIGAVWVRKNIDYYSIGGTRSPLFERHDHN